ncbi:hypothetical protein AA0Z99_05745 [Agrococcus sp. 1P02AA]|uniref:hypothetical protein n=1 Tax=Agrococcus sp. 1P02AA TaxID=3132259 RepID=UPI0039A6A6C7
MINISGDGFDGMFDDVMRQASDDAHEEMARGLADTARGHGLKDADSIELDLRSNSVDSLIDAERVRRRANDLLAGG